MRLFTVVHNAPDDGAFRKFAQALSPEVPNGTIQQVAFVDCESKALLGRAIQKQGISPDRVAAVFEGHCQLVEDWWKDLV